MAPDCIHRQTVRTAASQNPHARPVGQSKVVGKQGQRIGRQLTPANSLREDVGYANLQGGHQYFVTRLEGSKEVMLAGVNLETGRTDLMIPMRSDNPNLVIDENNASVYQVFGDQLIALRLQR